MQLDSTRIFTVDSGTQNDGETGQKHKTSERATELLSLLGVALVVSEERDAMTKMDRNREWLGITLAVVLVCVVLLWFGATPSGRAALNDPAITPGSAAQARDYYVHISSLLSFEAKPNVTTLDDFLAFVGYPTSGAKLEALDSDVLMNPVQAASADTLNLPAHGLNGAALRSGDILASRFFAPKIVNVSV